MRTSRIWRNWGLWKQIRKLQRDVDEVSVPKERETKLTALVTILQNVWDRLEEEKNNLWILFRRRLARWWGVDERQNEGFQRPFTITEDSRLGWRYKWGAIGCIIVEALLAWWILANQGFKWWVGPLVAILLVIIFEAAFSYAVHDPVNPWRTVGRIKRWLLWPSFIVFIVSVLLVLLARTVPEEWVPDLLVAFNVSLWLVTVATLLLGASLLSAGHVVGWSRRDEREYDAIVVEQQEISLLKVDAEGRLGMLREQIALIEQPRTHIQSSAEASEIASPGNGKAVTAMLLVLSTLWLWLTPVHAQVAVQKTAACTDLDIHPDHSRSPDEDALRSSAQNLIRQLPAIIHALHVCGDLRVIPWHSDGWSATETLRIELPALGLNIPKKSKGGEIAELFPNIQTAINERGEVRRMQDIERAKHLHRQALEPALSKLTENSLLPSPESPQPRCTDLQGILRRISETVSSKPRLVILITDGHETCSSSVKAVPEPKSDTIVVVMLVPEKISRTVQEGGWEQFDTRSRKLSQEMPWVVVVPHFSEDLAGAFTQMRQMRPANGNKANSL